MLNGIKRPVFNMKADIKVKKLEEDYALSRIRVDAMVLKQILNST